MAKGLTKEDSTNNIPKPKKVTPVEQLIPQANKVPEIKNEQKTDIVESEEQIIPSTEGEKMQVQSITVINNSNQLKRFKIKRKKIEKRLLTELELDYYNRLDIIRNRIDNPSPINRLNKRRKYSEDTRRNVTFSIREDIAILLDDIVDDAKIYKGKFNDEVMLLGIKKYLELNGIGNNLNKTQN